MTRDSNERRGSSHGDEPPSVRAAVAKFALGGLAATLVLAAVGAFALARVSRNEAIKDAKRLTEVVGQDVVQPNLTDGLLRGDPRSRARVDRVVRGRVLRDDLTRVKIWSADGRILYSDRRELLGSRYRLGADEHAVLRDGGVDAGVSDLSRPENRFERGAGKLLEVYLPLRTPGGRPLLFETYLRYSGVTATGRDLWLSFVPALLGALLVLQLIQLPLARSLARRVEAAHREREGLLRRSLDASELERRRIAADLHDGTVQELVGATYALSAARERLDPESSAAAELERAAETCRAAVRELRNLLVEIYPPRLRDAELASVLEDLVTPLAKRGIDTSVEAPPDLRLPYEVTALIYRTAREAVRNAADHADPRKVGVRVAGENGRFVLSVVDDGSGFVPGEALARPAQGHFGLRLLSDQVRDAGGTLEIDSRPGGGTTVRVEVPAT
jgi:two-component system, NarL family, sensor kinase